MSEKFGSFSSSGHSMGRFNSGINRFILMLQYIILLHLEDIWLIYFQRDKSEEADKKISDEQQNYQI